MDFRGHTVIITGAANGIGKALAVAYAARAANVVLADVDREHGEQNTNAIRQSGGSAIFV